ncbi:Rubrerythrin [Fundidesulfovibrio magnetotacticus]|uniref:Rubrerythrin n=1 Tax=Fundidesulfovibrio magnetotacticus TaxID=2730080 RepID=A0A6V8LYA4_9BACT|nr:rubrerythrin family protein [Fundidesulfovibrio magnetotacticus]GFK95571.1 Rubrerythrin [Fundidesulfovibrio magnetotacticus]
MPDLKGSRTEKNLLAAFAGECQAHVRYAFHAKQAKKEGYEQIAALFLETSEQEKAHARRFSRLLGGLSAEVTLPLAFPESGPTLDNLERSALGEERVGSLTYPEAAGVARDEGFAEAALVFEHIARAEIHHQQRFRALAENLRAGSVFARPEPVLWRCRHCGWTHEAKAAPERCPACAHPQAHFEITPWNW